MNIKSPWKVLTFSLPKGPDVKPDVVAFLLEAPGDHGGLAGQQKGDSSQTYLTQMRWVQY